jgi:hypothetical protein
MCRYLICPGFLTTVPLSLVLKSSVPLSCKIGFGMHNVPGFSKPQKHNTSGNVYGHFEFSHNRRKCDSSISSLKTSG